jgi:DNA-binding IclR family transcriptional regulator
MTKSSKRPKSDYAIQTVANALSLLEAFQDEEELGVSELSRRLGLHKNNVFRLLATLEERGYVEQAPRSERYLLGARALELGQSLARKNGLLRLARPVLRELGRRCGESAHLGVVRDLEVVHLDGEPGGRLVKARIRVGERLPVHCTALGKAILAFADDELRAALECKRGADGRLDERTRATLVDREKLLEALGTVRARGFSVDLEECEEGLRCVAAPVLDAEGRAVAALSLSAPAFRAEPETLESRLAPQVMAAADRLSRSLGYPPA